MLGATDAVATLAVKNLDAARRFYEGTLGLTPLDRGGPDVPAIVYRSGSSTVLVYESRYAGTNEATAASWAVGDDFGSIVAGLKARGVAFEHYDDLPDTTRDGDVHVSGDFRSVWFRDPDGNILNVVNQSL